MARPSCGELATQLENWLRDGQSRIEDIVPLLVKYGPILIETLRSRQQFEYLFSFIEEHGMDVRAAFETRDTRIRELGEEVVEARDYISKLERVLKLIVNLTEEQQTRTVAGAVLLLSPERCR